MTNEQFAELKAFLLEETAKEKAARLKWEKIRKGAAYIGLKRSLKKLQENFKNNP